MLDSNPPDLRSFFWRPVKTLRLLLTSSRSPRILSSTRARSISLTEWTPPPPSCRPRSPSRARRHSSRRGERTPPQLPHSRTGWEWSCRRRSQITKVSHSVLPLFLVINVFSSFHSVRSLYFMLGNRTFIDNCFILMQQISEEKLFYWSFLTVPSEIFKRGSDSLVG